MAQNGISSLSGEVSLGLNDVDGEDVGGHGEGEVEPAAALRVVTPAQVGDTLLPPCCLQSPGIVLPSGGNGSGYESIINDKQDNMTGPDTSCEHSCNKLKNIGIKMSQFIALALLSTHLHITSNI